MNTSYGGIFFGDLTIMNDSDVNFCQTRFVLFYVFGLKEDLVTSLPTSPFEKAFCCCIGLLGSDHLENLIAYCIQAVS